MNNWWNCEAKEVKRQPSAVTRPPKTAVSLVLFLRQNAIVTGETSRATPVDIAPSHPINRSNFLNRFFIRCFDSIFGKNRLQLKKQWINIVMPCILSGPNLLFRTDYFTLVKFSRKRKTVSDR